MNLNKNLCRISRWGHTIPRVYLLYGVTIVFFLCVCVAAESRCLKTKGQRQLVEYYCIALLPNAKALNFSNAEREREKEIAKLANKYY